MGKYPGQYQQGAIALVEPLVKSAVENRLVKEGWRWKAPRFLLSSKELGSIHLRLDPHFGDEDLVRFVGIVFSRVLPVMHYEFTSDGFYLGLGGSEQASTIVVKELPPCFHGYEQPWRQGSYRAALATVRSLIDWTLLQYAEGRHDGSRWPVGDWGGADLIHGELYRWIQGLGQFGYCRTRNVIEFIYEAVPDLRDEWETNGLTLIPRYHVNRVGRERFTSLRLVRTSPA